MILYIIRHGETDWNKEYKLQGQTDISLNENGRNIARITAKAMEKLRLDYIYSSPLERAYETASIIRGKRKIEIVKDARLMEVAFGEYEGTTWSQRGSEAAVSAFFEHPERYVADKGAESMDELLGRTKSFIDEVILPLEKEKPDANILVSGHGALNKALMLNLRNLERKDFWDGKVQKNCSVAVFKIESGTITMLEQGKVYY